MKNSLLICIGGGVISDLGGFIASIYKRGIDYIFIPTTLLAQVDASLGGKNGVDFKATKNQLGVINFPSVINISPIFLATLPKNQIISGYAEVVKYALIWDKDFWNMLLSIDDLDGLNWLPVIKRSIKIKSEIVDKDPYEKGIRKSLNFGHTIGHAIESIYLKKGKPILHGEAIAAGMECELYISSHYFNWEINSLKKVVSYLRQTFLDIKLDHHDMDELIYFMKNDKKNRGDGINFTLIEDIGVVIIDQLIPEEIIKQSIDLYISLRSNDKLKS
jgi:3-dehydroquinate synthase